MLTAFRLFARLGSASCVLLGLSVLAGWMIGAQAPLPIRPDPGGMTSRSALAIVLGGLAIGLRSPGRPGPGLRSASRLAAALLLAGGLLFILGHAAAGYDVLGSLLPHLPSGGRGHPGRIAPTSVFCFALLGLALVLSDRRGGVARRVGDGCALLGLLVSGLVMLCYAYGVPELRALMMNSVMALSTASCQFVLFAACLASGPGQGVTALLSSGRTSARNSRMQLLLETRRGAAVAAQIRLTAEL